VIETLHRKLRYLRLTPFDTTTGQGRSAERYRLAAWALVASTFSRAAGLALMVASIRLTAPYLGTERFGVWAVFSSLVAMLSFADLGIGNAMVNRVSAMRLSNDASALTRAISGGIGLLALVGAAVAVVLLAVAGWLDWGRLLKLSAPVVAEEARSTAMLFALFFGVNLVASGALRAMLGLQRGFEVHLVTLSGTLAAGAALWLVAKPSVDVPTLLCATFGVQTIFSLLAALRLAQQGQLRMSGMGNALRTERAPLLKVGSLFFGLQIAAMVGWGADSLVLGSVAGASQVAAFAVSQRLFQLVTQPLAMLNAPLWSAYADAWAQGDSLFLRRTLVRSLTATIVLSVVLAAALCWAAPSLVSWWTRGAIDVPPLLLALAAFWAVLEATGNALAMYLNGVNIVRQQFVVVMLFCVIGVPLKVAAAVHFGAIGLVATTIAAYLLTTLLPYMTVFRPTLMAPLSRSAS
jgi:O-antigen/teichoic acid export membrane protein